MGRTGIVLLPTLQRRITAIGENLRLARLRRRLSAAQVSERAGITRPTLRAIERGDPSVSFGNYASVLFCLGLEKDLEGIALDDVLGRKLQDLELTTPQRAKRRTYNPQQNNAKPETKDQ